MPIYACVEGGGTTFVVALAKDDPTNIIEREEFPTTTPNETIGKCVAWLQTKQYDVRITGSMHTLPLQLTLVRSVSRQYLWHHVFLDEICYP